MSSSINLRQTVNTDRSPVEYDVIVRRQKICTVIRYNFVNDLTIDKCSKKFKTDLGDDYPHQINHQIFAGITNFSVETFRRMTCNVRKKS